MSERKKLEIQRDSERFRGAPETLTQGDRQSKRKIVRVSPGNLLQEATNGYLDAVHMRLPRGRSEANTAWPPMSHGPRWAIQGAGLDRPSTDNAPYGLAGRPAIVHAVRPSW